MARNRLFSLLVLYPISKIYGMVVGFRNMLFNKGILRQYEPDIPVVVVGNISVGGAGKTPHTEFVVEGLRGDFKIGILSRGYKRHTRGFVLAGSNSGPADIGDEPFQMFRKFGHQGVMVAVCEDRVKGIKMMRDIDPELNLIVMDDAFQHRYVKPTIAIVLTEYSLPAYKDYLLPYGRLREPVKALSRADVVIVTKCPDDMKPVEYSIFKSDFNLFPYQKLLFSRYVYQKPCPLFPESVKPGDTPNLATMGADDTVLAVVGVANPRPFLRYIRSFGVKVKVKRFGDHHNFSQSDMEAIVAKYKTIKTPSSRRPFLLTTEKDAVRLARNPYFPPQLRSVAFFIPIQVELMPTADQPLTTLLKQMLRTHNTLRH